MGLKDVQILADVSREAMVAYGVADDRKEIALPATFVVGKDGKVKYTYVRRKPPDRPDPDAVIAAIP